MKASGEMRYLSDYPESKQEYMKKNTFALYKFSNKPASVFFSADKKSQIGENDQRDFLLDHGI